MTPSWLEAHASYIDSSRSIKAHELTFSAGSTTSAALLKDPMIPACACKDSPPLAVEITVAIDLSVEQGPDSDTNYGVSDGSRFSGFHLADKLDYEDHSPWYRIEGLYGSTLTSKQYLPIKPKPSVSVYPGQFVFTLMLDGRWDSCYFALDGSLVRTASYNN